MWWLIVVTLTCAALEVKASGQVRVTRSAVESLRIHDNYIIHFRENVTEKRFNRFVNNLVRKSNHSKKFNAQILQKFFTIKCLTARLSTRALKWVTRRKIVMAVKENEYIIIGADSDSSSHAHGGWHLDKIHPSNNNSFAAKFSGSNVDVYVLDSGINYEHNVFNGRAHYPGCDPIDKAENQNQKGRDCEGHGTHVAGLIGGKGTGVASGANIFSVRILDCSLIATEETLIEGLLCVVNHRKSRNGTRAIINLAIAGKQTTLGINKALQLALNNDIIIVASAGNGRQFRSINFNSCKAYPAGYPGVINVGSTDIDDNALMGIFDNNPYFTNMGKCLDVFAPGYSILSSDLCPPEASASTCHSRTCRSFRSGTSQSSGIVAGAVALLLEKCPKLTYIEIKNMLRHMLSIKAVKFFKKALHFISTDPSLFDVIKTIAETRDNLLHLDLAKVNCSAYHGKPLF